MRIGGLNIRLFLLAQLALPAIVIAAPSLAEEITRDESQIPAHQESEPAKATIHAIAARPVEAAIDEWTEQEIAARSSAGAASPEMATADANSFRERLPLIEPAPLSLDIQPADAGRMETTAALKRRQADRPAADEATLAPTPAAIETISTPSGQAFPATASDAGAAPHSVLASSAAPIAAEKPLSDAALAAETPAAGAARTGEIAGPDLPDAEIAKLIMRKLASRKGKLDESIAQFYETRANRPLWIEEGTLKPLVKDGLAALSSAADHGMKPESYKVSIKLDTLEAKADSEIELSRVFLKYVRDARGARINPRKISSLITAEPTLPDTADALARLAAASDLREALEAFQPQQAGYKALQRKLADLHHASVEAVSSDQKLGSAGADDRLEKDIVANMERWRWMPPSLGSSYVIVNVPDFELKVIRDGQLVHQTKVIVGKPQTPTPIFSHAMEYLIVNPYWNIPPSIALKEMLPQLKSDPYALQRKGFEIVKGGKAVDPSGVDWTGSIKNVRIRQPPGERNALGFIKFMFPNDHSVYLHDTPSRGLFARSVRAFSHGCVRVFEPFALAEILLNHQNGLTERQLRGMIGSGERYIYLQNKIPVHIAYFTTFVDEDGTLQSKPDIYGHNAKVKAALQTSE